MKREVELEGFKGARVVLLTRYKSGRNFEYYTHYKINQSVNDYCNLSNQFKQNLIVLIGN